ncbi:nuclease domain-containing protein [Paenibacillus sp. P36]|uniref:nuclease domain-containing protein n=1 Tax=Paenibacillus sp. P36 TaxID=3342538 RepID=UPI0038B2C6D8
MYRQCYQWFDLLYKHGNERIGFQYSYPLKETYALYEIWCYMQLVKVFREKGLLKDSTGIFKTNQNGLFLNFLEHNESVVKLTNGMSLYYQRVYQYNSSHFYTFTQQMKPDIVIEAGDRLYILDPKYRDSHPVIIVCARDIVDILRNAGIVTIEQMQNWLQAFSRHR